MYRAQTGCLYSSAPMSCTSSRTLANATASTNQRLSTRLRRLWPHNTEGRTTRCAKRDTDIRRRLTVASRGDQHLGQRVIERCMTVRAPWPHRLDRRPVVDERNRNVGASGHTRVAKVDDVHAEPSEHLTGQSFDVEHAEQHVPGGHLWLLFFAREPACSFERPLCPGRERQRFAVWRSSVCSQYFDHLVARSCEIYPCRSQHVSRLTVIVREQSEKQMLGANSSMIEPSCLHRRQRNDTLSPDGVVLEHDSNRTTQRDGCAPLGSAATTSSPAGLTIRRWHLISTLPKKSRSTVWKAW